jgi:hypothetical protein
MQLTNYGRAKDLSAPRVYVSSLDLERMWHILKHFHCILMEDLDITQEILHEWHQLYKKQDTDKYTHSHTHQNCSDTATYTNTYKDQHHMRHSKKWKIFYIITDCITILCKGFPTKILLQFYLI